MRWWVLVALLATLSMTVDDVGGARILFISALASKSHKGFFTTFSNKLAENGHQVTLVSPYKPSKERKNVREVVLSDIDITSFLPNLFDGNTMTGPKRIMTIAPSICSDALGKKEVQDLLKEEYDLGMMTIFLSDCFLSLFHQMKIPFLYVNPAGLIGPIGSIVGNPGYSSFVTSPFLHNFHPFTFTQRIVSAFADVAGVHMIEKFVLPNMEVECRRRGLCREDMPSLLEVRQNASLLFVNSVRSMEWPPRPVLPAIVHMGGIHCQKSKPLPKDLEDWVAGAGEDGFIFFSLGSVVQPSSMPEEYRKALVKAFSSLKQRVLWKWNEDSMEGLPPNVRLGKWLPQQDILGDPRLRLFITHGGALSTMESIYHGTPVIGLPVFADQMTNMIEVQQQGWGRVLKWEELTPQLLKDTIHTVMNDERLRAEVKRRSTLMRDIPQDPAQVVNYWTDYVIRHKGAHHLKSPMVTMEWYRIYNVDVWLFIVGVVVLLIFLLFKFLRMLYRKCCSSKKKSKRE